jgi:hypothetical protein
MTGDSQGVDVQAVVQADRFPIILSLLPYGSLRSRKEEKEKIALFFCSNTEDIRAPIPFTSFRN